MGQNGGAIAIHWKKSSNNDGYLKVIDSNLTNNTSSYYGAAIYITGSFFNHVELSKTEIVRNTAWYDNGNTLALVGKKYLNIDNCLIKENLSKQSGSIVKLSGEGSSSIAYTEIIDNTVGSAPIIKAYKKFTMHNSIMNHNIGSWMMSVEEGKIYNNKFLNQTTSYSSHYYIKKGILVNNIFQNNMITETSTALIVMENGGYIINNTFYQNKDTSGYSYNAVLNFKGSVINTIFYDDLVTNAIKFTGSSNVYNTYVDYNKLLNHNNYTVIKKNNKKPIDGDIALDINGKPLKNSLAINNGLNPYSHTFKNLINDTKAYNTILAILKTDILGNNRIEGKNIDMGAYEHTSDNSIPSISPLIMYLLK